MKTWKKNSVQTFRAGTYKKFIFHPEWNKIPSYAVKKNIW